MRDSETMRHIDAILSSNVFWGIFSVVLLVIGWRWEVTRAVAFLVAWLSASYMLYRFWSLETVQDWRLLAILILLCTTFILFIQYFSDASRPVSRPIIGEPPKRGTFVTSVSFFNVGGSPSQITLTPPPGRLKPKKKLNLVFQNSPLLTDKVKGQITEDISAFHEYFIRLDLPAPDNFPPLGVSDTPGSAQSRIMGLLPNYRSDVKINQNWFLDRRALTEQYVNYALEQMLRGRTPQHPGVSDMQDMIVATAVSQYYNWSFWDHKEEAEGGYWSTQLWEIRCKLGKKFTDSLVGYALKLMLDNPEDGADPDFDLYFFSKLKTADSIIDSNAENIGKIKEIIEKSGVNVTQVKASLTFSGTMLKRNDESFVSHISVNNNSGVTVQQGQIRILFAPDVKLTGEPKGALKDPSTTLTSARIVPIKEIAVNSALKLKFEFSAISKSPGRVFMQFDYSCETCIKDTHSPSLVFVIDASNPD
jgi:hypothetical protein